MILWAVFDLDVYGGKWFDDCVKLPPGEKGIVYD